MFSNIFKSYLCVVLYLQCFYYSLSYELYSVYVITKVKQTSLRTDNKTKKGSKGGWAGRCVANFVNFVKRLLKTVHAI